MSRPEENQMTRNIVEFAADAVTRYWVERQRTLLGKVK